MTTLIDRLLGRPTRKVVNGGPAAVAWQNDVPLSVRGGDWQARARMWLDAYKVGWFYKGGSRIARDFANLEWTLAYEDTEGDNAEDIVAPANNIPFEQLDPLEQFLRLAEHPNPFQTGRAFRQQQQIRLDFTGRALVYLEGGDGNGLPSAFYGVNPCRMWQSRNAKGELIGWVLDKERAGGGLAFSVDEIVAIEYPGTDEDPQGVVEAVYAHVPLAKQVPQHVSDVLQTGGRLAGMAWPKNRALTEDEFVDAQRAWRNVASDPNAARRLLLFPEPMEYAPGAASPQEIGLPELATLSRDEILSAFPIHPYMVGVPLATGLNSGESLRYVRQEYWEGSQHPRVETWEDAFQQQVIGRYESAVGRPLDFDIEEPDLDDAPAIIEKVGALKGLISVGFDPKEAVASVRLDGIAWNGLPSSLNPSAPQQPTTAAAPQQSGGMTATVRDTSSSDQAATTQQVISKAVKARREQVVGEELPGFHEAMRSFLLEQRLRIIDEVERVLGSRSKAERKAAPEDWWDKAREDGLLRNLLRGLYVRLARSALQVVANEVGRFVYPDRIERVTEAMLAKAADRISGINETTRKAVADAIAEGVRRGYSIPQIANGVAGEDFNGLRDLSAFDEARAELVARTETMLAYNESAVRGYSEFGVERVEAIDGDGDPECAERNGQVFTVDEALAIEDHPNGTLDWVPLTA